MREARFTPFTLSFQAPFSVVFCLWGWGFLLVWFLCFFSMAPESILLILPGEPAQLYAVVNL